MAGMPVIGAAKGDCRLFVVDRLGTGWTRELMESLGGDTNRNVTIFRGEVYDGDPTWLMVVANIYFKNLRRLGLGRSAMVLGVASSPACDGEPLRWTEL
jgi:hypothetical protein